MDSDHPTSVNTRIGLVILGLAMVFLLIATSFFVNTSPSHDVDESTELLSTATPETKQERMQVSCYDCGMTQEHQHCELLPTSGYWPKVDKHIGYCYTNRNLYLGHEWRLEENIWADSKNPETVVPPRLGELDNGLLNEYTLESRTPINSYYLNNVLQSVEKLTELMAFWTPEYIDAAVDAVLRSDGKLDIVSYGKDSENLYTTLRKYEEFVKNKHGAVVGSLNPWVEIYALAAGSKMLTTIEYLRFDTDIPNIHRLHPSEIPNEFYSGSLDFDFAVSFSSLEHSGLGRYGDPIDPFGDFKAMGQISCMVKPGGLLFLAVPFSDKDSIQYNAHRIYGPIRMPYMLENWRFIDYTGRAPAKSLYGQTQGVVVLQNMRSCDNGWNSSMDGE